MVAPSNEKVIGFNVTWRVGIRYNLPAKGNVTGIEILKRTMPLDVGNGKPLWNERSQRLELVFGRSRVLLSERKDICTREFESFLDSKVLEPLPIVVPMRKCGNAYFHVQTCSSSLSIIK